MSGLATLLSAHDLVPPLSDAESELAARELAALSGLSVYAKSIAACHGRLYFLARAGHEKRLCVMAASPFEDFDGDARALPQGVLKICPLTHAHAVALRRALPYLVPKLTGGKRSVGMGDRLGIATPGHIRALAGTGVTPILAQQSIREMQRTGRSPDQVMDDAAWGVFEEGFRAGFGSDADHLKTTDDIDATFAAGFRLFTIDPGDHVDNAAGRDDAATLRAKCAALPWADLETTESDTRSAFVGKRVLIGHNTALAFDEETFLRAAAKYGRAVAHVKTLYRHLAARAADRPVEVEMSVDETDSPTTPHEHFYVAHELRRLGVQFVSLAPRFLGAFEKGVDYKGDLKAFEDAFIQHVRIAHYLGPYKISIHSGSDKFSVYPIAARHAGEMIHVKTAGTSYLEALRALAEVAPALFRDILAFALTRYGEDKATYHVSADTARVPAPDQLADARLASVLDSNDGRQVLHVTYGSVLNARNASGASRFRDRMYEALRAHEETHYSIVARHLRRHIEPFAARS